MIFTENEIISLYKIMVEHQENIPKTEEEIHEDYYDNYEELVDKKTIKSILRKLGNNLPAKEKEKIDKDFIRQKYSSFNNPIDEKVYSIIEKAFNQLKTVEISYFNFVDADFIKRNIDIYYKSRRYVIGYCHLRNGIRKFRTNKIASAKSGNSSYKIPEDFDKNKY